MAQQIGIQPGWPCASLGPNPPSVQDILSYPTPQQLLPQVLQLTPRGAAWGTDEAAALGGANPVMLGVWTALAARAAWNYSIEYELATQCFPTMITYSIADWENELGLPDACNTGTGGLAQRIAAVSAKFGALGGQSPAYYICLAQSLGYTIIIEEPTQFLCDVSECVGASVIESSFTCDDGICGETPLSAITTTDAADYGDPVSDLSLWKYWIVHVYTGALTYFTVDDSQCNLDPLSGFTAYADLECVFNNVCPPHTELIFDYTPIQS